MRLQQAIQSVSLSEAKTKTICAHKNIGQKTYDNNDAL